MPPPKSNKKLTAAQKETAQALDRRRGPSTSRTGRSSPPTRPRAARGEERGLGPQPDRPLRPRRSWRAPGLTPAPEADRRTLARRLSLDLTGLPPDAGRRRGVRQRHVAGRLREATSIELLAVAALGRAPRPLLARRRPLRRHARHPLRQLPRDVVVPRLGHQGLQPQHAVRPVHDRAARRRPAARTARSTSRSPRASTAATSRPTKAARSTRSTSCSTPATAPRRRRRSGWA